jgi:NADPH:quinone reductase-like Zn-dependent oxidoreductase
MRAFVIDEFGQAGSVREVPDPQPSQDQLVVRIRAAGVNPADWAAASGMFAEYGIDHKFPLIPGNDLSGEVVKAPQDSPFSERDEVFGAVPGKVIGEGSWAELVAVGGSDVAVKPTALDHTAASGVATAGLTALEVVEATGLEEGAHLLVVGATGGVGSYATQLAALRGIRVLAVSRGEKADYARELGASETVDYTRGDLVELVRAERPTGVDALIDLASDQDTVQRLSEVVRKGGAIVSARGAVDVHAMEQQGKRGVNAMRAPLERLRDLIELIETGKLKTPPTKTYPLERAQEAMDEIATGHVMGKLALAVV